MNLRAAALAASSVPKPRLSQLRSPSWISTRNLHIAIPPLVSGAPPWGGRGVGISPAAAAEPDLPRQVPKDGCLAVKCGEQNLRHQAGPEGVGVDLRQGQEPGDLREAVVRQGLQSQGQSVAQAAD